jgi:hypothetical protein
MNFLNFILKNLVAIHKGSIELKVKSTLAISLASFPFAVIADAVSQWFHLNIAYILFVFGAVIIDHLLGSYVHAFIKRDFNIKKNIQGFMVKVSLIVSVFFLGRGIVHILGDDNIMAHYFNTMMRLMVFIYPAGSALMNCSLLTGGKFPPIGFLEKLKRFNENLNIKEFGADKPNEQLTP